MTKSHVVRFAGAALLATGVSLSGSISHAADSGNAAWNTLADQYFDSVYFPYQPTNGTLAGFHQYDAQLERYDRNSIAKQAAALHAFERRVSAFPKDGLDEWSAGDRQLVLNNIHSTLLTLETIKPWEKNPDFYSTGITGSAFTLMEREFAPPEDRLRSLIARERQMPAALNAARANLHDCPRIYTEIALEQLPGDIDFFRNDVPAAFSEVKDQKLLSEFKQSNVAVIDALSSYESWIKSDVLPRSNGDFRIGRDTFALKLLYDEMVTTPLDQLLQIGYADLHKNRAAFDTLAHEVDPTKTPQQVLLMLGEDHPVPGQLLASFRDTFNGLIEFIRTKHIVTIPSDVRPTLEETPPFMRATTQASMDTPGPFETNSTTAYFNVTLPGKSWSAERTGNYMHAFNRGTLVSTSVHEAYPGHYVQFLVLPEVHSKARKLLGANTDVEGWAHYCEQMMLDEGYGQPGAGAKDAREAKLIRLGQLQDALLRDARFIVGIQMHTGNMTLDQARSFFVNEGYQSREIADVETKRGTADPTYLYYTLGKLEILKLRADVEKKEGNNFSLQNFHDEFLRQGFPPIAIIRRAMLGDNSPAL
ncbi:MAG: hypothetical protein QOK38_355 [Acidobacteriaceae bacterium]|nr:hypothetical protein [Acidobacteriaceae bacterium]